MHICPQEVIAVIQSVEYAKPLLSMVKYWCMSCFDGTHKSCEDHAADVKRKEDEATE